MDEPAPTHDSVPAHTTPTWEMELLVSGATIFGLLQLPTLLDHGYFRLVNLVPESYANLMLPLWLYSKIAVVTLVLTFLVHLFLRGYWVALVGMDSVYPGGTDWDRMGLGPITRARFGASGNDMPASIERADNRATRVFGMGFSFAMLVMAPMLLAVLAIGVSVLVGRLLGGDYTLHVLFAVVVLVVVPWLLATTADRRFGGFLETHPAAARLVSAVAGAYGRFGMGPRSNPLVSLISSRVGRMQFSLAVLLVITPVAIFSTMQARDRLPAGMVEAFTGKDAFSGSTSASAFYADTRGDGYALLPLPHIRSRVVDGPYLELFVPFVARLHGPAMRRACPGAADERARLDCLARMLAIQIDGKPVPVAFDASTDSSTGQPGMIAMMPVGALAPGRHELSLREPDRRVVDGAETRRYRIPFWK